MNALLELFAPSPEELLCGRINLGFRMARTVPALIFDASKDVSPKARKLIAL